MKKIHKFFSKDLLHILGAVGIFVAFLISIAYKQVGIGALIAAWLIAIAIIGVAWITDIRKADLLKNGKIVSGKVNAVKRVHIKFHMSTYHLADEDVIYPWVIRYQYKIGKDTYYGQSHWFWFNPLVSKGTPIKVTIDPQNPKRSIVAAWVWGDRIFEKCGIRRDEGGDGGKTLEIRGKRRLSARDGGANYQQS